MVLQAERLDGRAKRTHQCTIGELPDGAVLTLKDQPRVAFALRGSNLLRWSEHGYVEKVARPHGLIHVLTPPSIVGVLAAGYQPQWHPTAGAL